MQHTAQFTAAFKKSGKWYLGWLEEVPGVNTQGRTLKEARENLREAAMLVIETNNLLNCTEHRGAVVREPLRIIHRRAAA